MNKPTTKDYYEERIAAAIEYINRHLDEELELERIAGVAHFSPYHFHRIFRAFRGEPLGSYISRLRVEAAAQLLRYSELPVETIAYNVGFGVPSSLSKAFRQFYGITPSEYRTDKTIHIMKAPQINPSIKLNAPKILELEPKTALCVTYTGDYKQLDYPDAFSRLWALVKKQGLFSAGIEHISIFHDDPKVTEASRLRTDICLVVRKPAQPEGGIGVKTIAGGHYAVFTHIGAYNEVGAFYDAIYGEWLPASGHKLRNEPVFEKYVNDPDRVAPEKLKTELYIPIE